MIHYNISHLIQRYFKGTKYPMKSYATNVPVHETVKYINIVSLQTPKVSCSCPACSSISIKLSTLSVQAYTHFISTRLYTLHSITN